jgi:Mg2+-importing ATPase
MQSPSLANSPLGQRLQRLLPGGHEAARAGGASSSALRAAATSDIEIALRRLDSSPEGLLDREATERLALVGPNAIAQERHLSIPRQLLHHFWNPLNLLLLTLSGLSTYLGDYDAATIITLMVTLSVMLSFVQEFRSNNAAERLRDMVSTTATVLRKDRRSGVPEEVNRYFNIQLQPSPPQSREVPLDELVPGDIVRLSAGDMIPADVRLISAKDLFVNQSSLTGEALPVEKFSHTEAPGDRDVLEYNNICFMGTNVVSGIAAAVVVETGPRTYFGALAAAMGGERQLTSFDRGVRQFTWLMLRFMAVMVPLVFLINGFTKHDWMEAFLFSMAVAVGLTPEMLPMIVTVNLGKGALAMSRKKVIVKRLNAIQNFGAMDVLCTDKTGTLTQDKIILEKHVDISGQENEKVLEYAYLNSYYQSGLKNLLDVAVLEFVDVHERLRPTANWRKVDEIPFDFQRRRMSVVVEGHGRQVLICKGAVEEVFACCTRCEVDGVAAPLGEEDLAHVQQVTRELNEDGFRVIAIGYRELEAGEERAYSVQDESELCLVGYIAFLDPPKDSAREAIAALNRHGVAVKILTGDNDIITRKVCREVGLEVDRIVLGGEIEKMNDQELAEVAEQVSVFAKLSPAQKARVVKALHLKSHVVGFLGDGINDGPALKAADVGISVDTAVDIAKESADIILLEKSLLVLEEGVIEGRKVFGNIIKYIKMGASSNFGNMFSVIGASAWLPFLPMQSIQVLTNNLLYDFSQTAIPTDHVDEEYLATPRRWDIAAITRYMLYIGPISSLFDYATYALMYFVFHASTAGQAGLFQTGWFVESLLSQTMIIHIIRTGRVPFVQSMASAPLMLTSAIICAVGVWLPYSPFAHALGFVPLPLAYWPWVVGIVICYLSLTHVAKTWFIRRFGLG